MARVRVKKHKRGCPVSEKQRKKNLKKQLGKYRKKGRRRAKRKKVRALLKGKGFNKKKRAEFRSRGRKRKKDGSGLRGTAAKVHSLMY